MRARNIAAALVGHCRMLGLTVTTAESCTGGLVAGAISGVAGASSMFGAGFVTYSDTAKIELLGVPAGLIDAVGAVSEAVALAMAQGAKAQGRADIAVAITGIAGPSGGSAAKPVGTVWFGLADRHGVATHYKFYPGDRDAVRAASVEFALTLLLDAARL